MLAVPQAKVDHMWCISQRSSNQR